MKRYLLHIILLIGYVGFAQQMPKVTAKADTTKIRIGERINYEIVVENTDKGVVFPEIELDSFRRIEVIESLPIDTLKDRLVKKYALTSFDSGQYVLPQQRVLIWSQEFVTDSLVIDVNTVAVDTLKQPMHEIKAIQNEPYTFEDYKKYLWWIFAILALIVALILYFYYRKKTSSELEAAIPPYELALKRLGELDEKQLWQNNKIKQYYVELTDIVRTYIERELNIPALESTTDELLATITDFNTSSSLNIPKETIDKLNKLLKEADLVKFAKFKPLANEIELRRNDSNEIVKAIHKNIPKELNIEKPKCLITGEEATETIVLNRWIYHIFYYALATVKIQVSPLGKELHLRRQSYFWKIVNQYGRVFINIPFLNGVLILAWLVWTFPILLLVIIIETIITGRFLDRGMIILKKRDIVAKSIEGDKIKKEIDFIKNSKDYERNSRLRNKLARVIIIFSFIFPFLLFGGLYIKDTYFKTKHEENIDKIMDKVKKSIEEDEAVE